LDYLRENESVTVGPAGILGVELHEPVAVHSMVSELELRISMPPERGRSGIEVTHLLKRTWETGAIPMGAPGWPEFAFDVASTCEDEYQ